MANQGDFDFYCQEVLSGNTQVDKLFETNSILAFHHTKPSYETHIVIIPKKHILNLIEVENNDNKILLEILEVAKKLARGLDIETKGARLITNMGKFQDTPHLHFHLISGESINK